MKGLFTKSQCRRWVIPVRGNSVFYRLFYETAFGANGYLLFSKKSGVCYVLLPFPSSHHHIRLILWSTIFMNEPNLDVACGGGVNSLWVVVLMKSALSFYLAFLLPPYEYGFLVKHPRYDEEGILFAAIFFGKD